MQKDIGEFVEKLAKTEVGELVFNQYSYQHPLNQIRRDNLRLYLEEMWVKSPKALLVGEAPGYRGTRQSGVPFGGENILLKGIPELGLFGESKGYRVANEFNRLWKEPSATIVWQALASVKVAPLILAAFPYHPYLPGLPLSNRTPTSKELALGRIFLKELIEIFGIKHVIAVGNQADKSLKILGFDAPKIRHPARGGKNDFVAGLNKIFVR